MRDRFANRDRGTLLCTLTLGEGTRYGGFELLKKLQGTELSRTPIVVMTGRYTDSSTADMIRQEPNVVELLEKPVKATRFILALQRILRPTLASDDAAQA